MPWKLDENGQFVVDENKNPIFVLDGGEEKSVDYSAMSVALVRLPLVLLALWFQRVFLV